MWHIYYGGNIITVNMVIIKIIFQPRSLFILVILATSTINVVLSDLGRTAYQVRLCIRQDKTQNRLGSAPQIDRCTSDNCRLKMMTLSSAASDMVPYRDTLHLQPTSIHCASKIRRLSERQLEDKKDNHCLCLHNVCSLVQPTLACVPTTGQLKIGYHKRRCTLKAHLTRQYRLPSSFITGLPNSEQRVDSVHSCLDRSSSCARTRVLSIGRRLHTSYPVSACMYGTFARGYVVQLDLMNQTTPSTALALDVQLHVRITSMHAEGGGDAQRYSSAAARRDREWSGSRDQRQWLPGCGEQLFGFTFQLVRTMAFNFPAEIKCLFFSEFDPIAGPKISFQVLLNHLTACMPIPQFSRLGTSVALLQQVLSA